MHNIPTDLTSFVGRTQEVAELHQLLARARVVSLVGAGGIGKSRLAARVAAHTSQRYPDGVWLVELASLTDGTLLHQSLASALGIQGEKDTPLFTTLCAFFARKKALLLLDNCEHLIEACAVCIENLLGVCLQLSIMTTSREALGIGAETIFAVPPLSLPALDAMTTLEQAQQCEAVCLFLERARSVQPRFTLTRHNLASVVQICQQLDGIPLALELAAARLRLMPVAQLATRLQESFDGYFQLLNRGTRTAPARHQTLRAAIDWSHALLPRPEQILLRRLAVFASGWTLEAAEAICSDAQIAQEALVDLLGQLVNKSLVMVTEEAELTEAGELASSHARYHFLETLRHYAHEKLQQAGEEGTLQERHFDYFLALALEADASIKGPAQLLWLRRLDDERENLRGALGYIARQHADGRALQLLSALCHYWMIRTHFREGLWWLEELLNVVDDEPEVMRATALYRAGLLAFFQSDLQQLEALSERSLTLFRSLAHRHGIGCALSNLVEVARAHGDYPLALTRWEECRELLSEVGDDWTIALTGMPLLSVYVQQKMYSKAEAVGENSLALFHEQGDRWGKAITLTVLANVLYQRHMFERANAYAQESIRLFQALGDKYGAASAKSMLANSLLRQGHSEQGLLFMEESKTLFHECGNMKAVGQLLLQQGYMALQDNAVTRAEHFFEEGLLISRSNEDTRGSGTGLCYLGLIALQQRNTQRSFSLLKESFDLLTRDKNRLLLMNCIEALALLAGQVMTQSGHAQQIVRWLGFVRQMRATSGVPLPSWLRSLYEETLAKMRLLLSEEAFEDALKQGQAYMIEQIISDMRSDEAVALLTSPAPLAAIVQPQTPQPLPINITFEGLTGRELEVLHLIAVGQSNAEIARTLSISNGTVKTHLSSIYSKFGVKSRTAAVHYARKHNMM